MFSSPTSFQLLVKNHQESIRIREAPFVETEALLVQVTEQVERLGADTGSMKYALQQAPEVLHRISSYFRAD